MKYCRLVACCVAGAALCVCRAGVVGVGLAAHHPHTASEGTRATCLEVGLLRPCMGTHHPPSLHTPAWVEGQQDMSTTSLGSANNSSSNRTHRSKHQPLGLGRARTPSPRSWSTPDSCKSR